MKFEYDGSIFSIKLIDDGTLDTVIKVNGVAVRFTEVERNEDGSITEETITNAIEAYLADEYERENAPKMGDWK